MEDFEVFFKREFPALARSLAFVMGDADLGADTAQESFLRVFARWDRYASPEHARRSAIRIGMNLTRTRWRREHRIEALADRAEESAVRTSAPILPDKKLVKV